MLGSIPPFSFLKVGKELVNSVLASAAHILKLERYRKDQKRLAWPLRKDDTQIREAFHIF